ncbi:MAG: hypothetical protein J2P16_04125, partial [Mycobacterium sp.]|nr:hypothetical protein [Mycobacterium sp.]
HRHAGADVHRHVGAHRRTGVRCRVPITPAMSARRVRAGLEQGGCVRSPPRGRNTSFFYQACAPGDKYRWLDWV